MDHQAKVAYLLKDFEQRGISTYTAAPPFYRLLWRLGFEVTPPHFASFSAIAQLTGAGFGVAWGLFMCLFVWSVAGSGAILSVFIAIIPAVVAGALFGILMAAYYRWQAKKLALPPWKDYPAKAR